MRLKSHSGPAYDTILHPMISVYQTQLTAKKELAPSILHLTFSLREPSTITFDAGQYVILFVPNGTETPTRRLFSIVTPPQLQNSFELIVEIVPNGVASTYFLNLQIGETAQFQGPVGLFKLKENNRKKIFFATGTGIAPIFSMITHLYSYLNFQNDSHLFWGLKTQADIYLQSELNSIAVQNKSFHYTYCLSRETGSTTEDKNTVLGRVTNGFESMILASSIDINEYDYYVCGGREVTESLRSYLQEKSVLKENISFEKF